MQLLGGARSNDAAQVVAWAYRLKLGCAGSDDHLMGVDMSHAGGLTHDHGGSAIDGNDFVAVACVEHQHVVSGAARLGGSGCATGPSANNNNIDLGAGDPDNIAKRGLGDVGLHNVGERWIAGGWMATHHKARRRWGLTGAHIWHAVDIGRTVGAVAAEAQRAAVFGMLAAAQNRSSDRVTVVIRDGLAIDHDASIAH